MVYTVTFNPAIDYVVHTGEMKLGATNRSEREEMYFGGKGINVSIVLRELGIDSKAFGFTAGFTGEAIEKGLADVGIDTDFVRLEKGNSRINVKIKASEETELNGQGPDIDDKQYQRSLKSWISFPTATRLFLREAFRPHFRPIFTREYLNDFPAGISEQWSTQQKT